MKNLSCDYLIIGAGASTMAFIDTLITEIPSVKIILVDKYPAPGGHWVHAYDYVHLHQPSLVYGVTSRQLEGSWLRSILLKRTFPWNHYASKKEILAYFQKLVSDNVATGRIQYFPNSCYNLDQTPKKDNNNYIHSFSSMENLMEKEVYSVTVKEKMINGVLGECIIPSQNPVPFPVDKGIQLLTPNELYEKQSDLKKKQNMKFVVLGAGKTGMDTIIYLQTFMKIQPTNICWVIPNDVWMLGRGNPWSLEKSLLENNGDVEKAVQDLEEKDAFLRLDETKKITPTKFRFPVVQKDQLIMMRKVKNIIRKGRVISIQKEKVIDKEEIKVNFDGGNTETQSSELFSSFEDTLFIHCTSPGPFNGKQAKHVFVSDHELDLFLLFPPPISLSHSVIAYLEAAKRKGTLDVVFAKKLFEIMSEDTTTEDVSSDEILKQIIRPFMIGNQIDPQVKKNTTFASMTNLAIFFAVADKDSTVAYKWMKSNRLSFLSIPGYKSKIYESLCTMVSKAASLEFSERKVKMVTLLRDKLKPLEGM